MSVGTCISVDEAAGLAHVEVSLPMAWLVEPCPGQRVRVSWSSGRPLIVAVFLSEGDEK